MKIQLHCTEKITRYSDKGYLSVNNNELRSSVLTTVAHHRPRSHVVTVDADKQSPHHPRPRVMCGIFAYSNHNCPKSQKEIVDNLHGLDDWSIEGTIRRDGDRRWEQGVAHGGQGVSTNREDCQPGGAAEENERIYIQSWCFSRMQIAHEMGDAVRGAENSHPHTSDGGNEFLVVHNGIITNHQALRER